MHYKTNYKKAVIEAGKRMLTSGMTIETWGNISCIDRENGWVYITPSGMAYESLAESDIVVVDTEYRRLEGTRKASIETGLHVKIYEARPDVGAVIHTHPIYSTVFASIGMDIPLFHDEAAQALGDVVHTAGYALPGSEELAKNCVKALGEKGNACLLRSHGAVCVGSDLAACFKVSNVLEMISQIYQLILAAGQKPDPISEEDIAFMQDFVKNGYGQAGAL